MRFMKQLSKAAQGSFTASLFMMAACGANPTSHAVSAAQTEVARTDVAAQTRNLVDPCREPTSTLGGFSFGVAHVAGSYPAVKEGESFLLAGAKASARIGARSLKIYMTPNFREKYRETWPDDVKDLVSLARTEAYSALFDMPFDTFVITTYSFANGIDGNVRAGLNAEQLDAEYNEVRALAEHLMETYAGTGKTFVLQNWEGDWTALGHTDETQDVEAEVAATMGRWLQTRQQAVSDARVAKAASGVNVLHAMEANLLLDEKHRRVVDSVLPNVCVDAVSYSSWESLFPAYNETLDEAATVKAIDSNLRRAVSRVRANMKKPGLVYLGEVGFAENEMPASKVSMLGGFMKGLTDTALDVGLSQAIYWQIFDNECAQKGESCRGFWLVRPDGQEARVTTALRQEMAR
jgi:hypothetical protein